MLLLFLIMDHEDQKGEESKQSLRAKALKNLKNIMSRYTGPKRRLSKRAGMALFPKDVKALERKGAVPPGQRGTKTRTRVTDYGTQLREKQKARWMFGLTERQ